VNKPKRIAFFGSDQIAIPVLKSILSQPQSFEICGVLTQPDRRSGRGNKFQSNPIKQWALESNIPVSDPPKPGSEEVRWIKHLQADMALIMAYGHILKEELLNAPPYGCFNLHASLLPKYRGASPIETAIAMGEQESGVTLMQVVPQMDAGPVVDAEIVPIEESDQGATLRKKIADACVPLIARNLSSILDGTFRVQTQSESEATYCRKLTKSDVGSIFPPGFCNSVISIAPSLVPIIKVLASESSLCPGSKFFDLISIIRPTRRILFSYSK